MPDARRLDELSYEEMQVLADAGAKVLNAEAVEWARRNNIEIRCAATDGDRKPGTRIRHGRGTEHPRIVGVTAHPGLFFLTPEFPGGAAPAELEATLVAHGAADAQVWRFPGEWAALVPRQNVHGPGAFRDALSNLGGVDVREDLTLVSVVGRGLTTSPGRLAPARAALAAARVETAGQIVDTGQIAFLVDVSRRDDAVRALHDALV